MASRVSNASSPPELREALSFTNQGGRAREEQGHHRPCSRNGDVTVSWWTHKIRNLHVNDFVMAARTDVVFGGG